MAKSKYKFGSPLYVKSIDISVYFRYNNKRGKKEHD